MYKHLALVLIAVFSSGFATPASQVVEKSHDQDFDKIAREPGAVVFNPPKGWKIADSEALPEQVRLMVVGKGSKEFPPSINLSTEEFDGSMQDYLKIVKEINASQGSEWKDLGKIRTQAGEASLSQADAVTEWGPIRMMHVILEKGGVIYILTAAALKDEFPKFYKIFFDSLKSLKITEAEKTESQALRNE